MQDSLILPVREVPNLSSPWEFVPSSPSLKQRYQRLVCHAFRAKPRPEFAMIKPLIDRPEWIVLFVYAPHGTLTSAHVFTLSQLRDLAVPLLVVCAAPSPNQVPVELQAYADALYWKALEGYDFSAYTIALEEIARHSSGASVMLMNDSMFGPFFDLRVFTRLRAWELTGFTASSMGENHIQSYAFHIRCVDSNFMARMAKIFYSSKCFSRGGDVILCQEIHMARVAARWMSVGSLWYGDARVVADACLVKPFELIDAGFPFLKKSLLGKMSGFQCREEVLERLLQFKHPVTEL